MTRQYVTVDSVTKLLPTATMDAVEARLSTTIDGKIAAIPAPAGLPVLATPSRLVPLLAPSMLSAKEFDYFRTDGAAATDWSIASGVLTAASATGAHGLAISRGTVMGDGIVRANVTNLADSGSGYAGVALASTSAPGNYLIGFVMDALTSAGSRRAALYTFNPTGGAGNVSGFINLTGADTDQIGGNPVFALELERKGSTVTFRVNGQPIYSTTGLSDAWRYAGGVGVFSSGDKLATFRNISAHAYDYTPIRPGASTVVVLGSSITNGIGATGGAGGTTNFRTVLQGLLRTSMSSSLNVVNGGSNDSTSTNMLGLLPSLLSTNAPDVVVIETSVNDFKVAASGGLTADVSVRNMREIIRLVLQSGATPVLWTSGTMNPARISVALGGTDFTNTESYRKQAEVNNRVRQIASEMRLRLADVSHAFGGNLTTTAIGDGLHPTDAYHAILAGTISQAMTGSGIS